MKIHFFDTSLRDGEQAPGCTMRLGDKVDLAQKLESLGIDIVEAGFPMSSHGDFLAVQAVARTLKTSQVCALARALDGDIDCAYEAIKDAVHPRLHVFIATSPLHMELKLKLSEQQVLERIKLSCIRAKKYLDNVQFSFEDATRSNLDFLCKAVNCAVENGASCINLADTVGYASPQDITQMITYVKSHCNLDDVDFGIHCHNDLGMAVANSMTAINLGCNHVEGTITGIGERAGNAALEEVIMALVAKPEYHATHNINTKEIYSTSRMLAGIIGQQIPPNKPIIGANIFLHESGIHQHGVMLDRRTYEIITPESIGVPPQQMVLGKHSGKHAFEEYLKETGAKYTQEQLNDYFDKFKKLCDKKQLVTRLDVEALISGNRLNTQQYTLKNFLIATQKDGAFATVTLNLGDQEKACQDSGNGALDSSFSAVNSILNVDYRLTDYSLHAVTGGEDALGEAVVKLTNGVMTMTGRGVSTDIVEASLLAYLDAAGKLLELSTTK